jgi:hypothetical protein
LQLCPKTILTIVGLREDKLGRRLGKGKQEPEPALELEREEEAA